MVAVLALLFVVVRELWQRPPTTLTADDLGTPHKIKYCHSKSFSEPSDQFLSIWDNVQFRLGEYPGGATVPSSKYCDIELKFSGETKIMTYFCEREALVFELGDKRELYGFFSRPGAGGYWGVYYESDGAEELIDFLDRKVECR